MKIVVVGSDVCFMLILLKLVLSVGFIDVGVIVIDIGMVGIEEIYFVIKYFGVDGGIEVMVSYNFINYNGMKLVKVGFVLISGDIGLNVIKEKVEVLEDSFVLEWLVYYIEGVLIDVDVFFNGMVYVKEDKFFEIEKYMVKLCMFDYVFYMLFYVNLSNFILLKVVVNVGNGVVGFVFDVIE